MDIEDSAALLKSAISSKELEFVKRAAISVEKVRSLKPRLLLAMTNGVAYSGCLMGSVINGKHPLYC